MVKLNDPVFATVTDLSAFSQNLIDTDDDQQVAQAKAALCAAEAEVAAYIGTDSLEERQVVQTRQLRRLKAQIEVNDGPITQINSVEVGGDVLDPSILQIEGSWWIIRTDNILFPENTDIMLDYLAGYRVDSAGETTMPPLVRQAIIRVAVNRFTNPVTDLTEERIGDYAYVRGRTGDEAVDLPADVKALLRRVRRAVL